MLMRLKHDLTMAEAARTPGGARVDLLAVADMVAPGAKVLDVGCGDGELLRLLAETRGVDGRGIELSREGVNECVAKGLAVIQGDADTDLADYPDDAFDYVVLSQTLQATRQPRIVRCAATNVDPDTGIRDLSIPDTLMRSFGHADCGVYAEVIEAGEVAVGDELGP